jgi:cobalt-zinc-cadmium efflux system membrane fusion protein
MPVAVMDTSVLDGQPRLVGIPQRIGRMLLLILIGAGLGIAGYRAFGDFSGKATLSRPTATHESAPHLLRDGDQVTIPEGSPLRDNLTVDTVGAKAIRRTLVLPAVVEADPAHIVKILPPLAGRITQLRVQLGERIESGQPLVVLDSSDLVTAYADYDRAKVLLELALKNRDRQRNLSTFGGAAQKDQQQAEADYITAEVELQRTQARLRQIGASTETLERLRTVTVVAPISGSVTELTASSGAYWNDANAALMTVADLSTVWVTASIPESDSSLISKGQPVDVAFAAYQGEIFNGKVLFVSDVVDPETRRIKVRIAFHNPDIRLKPGMFANVTFFAPEQSLPMIPAAALIMKNDRDQVFVEVAPWTFEARPVEVAFQQGNQAIVKSGVKAGDRVVVKGGVLLND